MTAAETTGERCDGAVEQSVVRRSDRSRAVGPLQWTAASTSFNLRSAETTTRTVRDGELEGVAQGLRVHGSYEGDAGHTTASRPGEPLFRRAEAAGTDRQTAQESAIREVRVAAL